MEGMKSQQELADKEYDAKTITNKATASQRTCCWYGKTCRDGCDKFKDGKCSGIVHLTYPPKHADCPFADKACPQLDGWSEVTAGDPETGSGEATLGYQRPISKDEYVKLSAPWVTFVRQVKALFGRDPQIEVNYDEDAMRLDLLVDDEPKRETLKRLLPDHKDFGNVSLKIRVLPSTEMGYSSPEAFLRTAFKGNPVFFDAETVESDKHKSFTYILFSNETVQLWNDNLSDPHGITTTLYQDIAREVLNLPSNVYCCTQEGPNVIRQEPV